MTRKPLVVLTRRLPDACEERVAAHYRIRLGDDAKNYTPVALAAQAEGADAIIVTPAERIDAAAITALPASIKVISTFSVGFEHIDLAAAKARNMRVTNTPGVLTDATADIAMLLVLAATRRASEGERLVRAKAWTGWRPVHLLGTQITGKNLGIVGLGRIGAALAHRARAFGMKILYHGRRPAPPDLAGDSKFYPVLEDMLPHCDVLSLNCPVTPETKGLMNAQRLALLPKGAAVVNTARGALIDDTALIAALKSGHVASAGLDVYANEPALDQDYLELDNVFLLPHLGSGTRETREAMGMLAIDNLEAVLNGQEPPHPIA